jgi:CheY-like chemotaxis protein
MVRVLVAEDHVKLAEAVAAGLRREGMAVDVVLDGRQALDRVSVTGYDVIVLDRDLPEVHGDEVCRRLVAGGHDGRILMLTAAGAIEDRVDGLGLGADDYLPKPFAFAAPPRSPAAAASPASSRRPSAGSPSPGPPARPPGQHAGRPGPGNEPATAGDYARCGRAAAQRRPAATPDGSADAPGCGRAGR